MNTKKPRNKLTKKKAEEARRLYLTTNLSQKQIAERMGVHRNTISCIVAGRTWK